MIGGLLNNAIKLDHPIVAKEPPSFSALFAGVGFCPAQPAILGTISLDLFAVLLGGATALLPIYARDILQTGPWGLGILRAAPAVGALLMTVVLTRWTINRRVGMRMFQAVIVFGIATAVFAVSELLWLSLVCAADHGRGRYGQRGDPHLAGAARHAGRHARPGRRGELPFHQRLQPARPVRKRHHRGLVRHHAGGAARRPRHRRRALLWMKLFPTLRDVERLE